jgi:arylsulfatase A-like enzyme
MYEEVSHIPLLIHHPQLKQPGRRVSDLVQLVDLYPTVLEAFGIEPPYGIHGKSLMPYLLGNEQEYAAREVACYGRFGESVNITDGEWTLFIWPPGEENTPLYWHSQLPPQFGPYETIGPFENGEDGRFPVACARGEMPTQLFNVKNDPQQLHDQAAEHPDVVQRLKRQVAEFLERIGAPHEQFERLGLVGMREEVDYRA